MTQFKCSIKKSVIRISRFRVSSKGSVILVSRSLCFLKWPKLILTISVLNGSKMAAGYAAMQKQSGCLFSSLVHNNKTTGTEQTRNFVQRVPLQMRPRTTQRTRSMKNSTFMYLDKNCKFPFLIESHIIFLFPKRAYTRTFTYIHFKHQSWWRHEN